MAEVRQITIPWWVLLIIGAIIVVLFLKFCPGKKSTLNDKIASISAAIKATHIADSIQYAERENILRDSLSLIKQDLSVSYVFLTDAGSKLINILAENKRLLKKYSNWQGISYVDTSASLVPAAFVNDCKDCFTQLQKTTDSAEQYKYQVDQIQVLYISQARIDSNLIAECDSARLKVNKDYNNLRMAVEVNAKSLEPRRKLKIGIAGRSDNKFLPNGVGPGLMYEDKKDRNFAFTPIYGNGQPAYIVHVFVPLFSF